MKNNEIKSKTEKNKIINRLFGFRSKKWYKMILASIYLLINLMLVITAVAIPDELQVTSQDGIISTIYQLLLVLCLLIPYIFMCDFGKKTQSLKVKILCAIVSFVTLAVVVDNINSLHSDEYKIRYEEQQLIKAEEKAEAAQLKADEKTEAERLKAEEKAEAAQLKADEKTEAERIKAEEKAEEERIKSEAAQLKADEKTEAERIKAEEKAEEERLKAEAAQLKADEKAEAEHIKAEEKAEEERLKAEAAQLKSDEKTEAERLKAEAKAEEERIKAEEAEIKEYEESEAAWVKGFETAESNKTIYHNVGNVISGKMYNVTIDSFKQLNSGNIFLQPQSGYMFIELGLTIENKSKIPLVVSSPVSINAYVDGYSVSQDFTAAALTSMQTLDGTIGSGKKLKGSITYQVPKNWVELEVAIDPTLLYLDRVKINLKH